MSKLPMAHRFRAWLLSVWFGSFEGGMVRDAWKKKFTSQERERIIKLLETLKGTCDNDCDECRPHAERNAHYLTALQDLIKGENK